MYIVCTNTSGSDLSFTLAFGAGGELRELYSHVAVSENRANERFFAELDKFFCGARDMLGETIVANNIEQWVSITGPGSFTGVRIGIASISGIALGFGRKHFGLSSLDAAALISGRERLAVAARLRLNEYAVRDYDFKSAVFSDIIVCSQQDLSEGVVMINNGKDNTSGFECITSAIADFRVDRFLSEPAAVYVKRSEAEISFDKKSFGI